MHMNDLQTYIEAVLVIKEAILRSQYRAAYFHVFGTLIVCVLDRSATSERVTFFILQVRYWHQFLSGC